MTSAITSYLGKKGPKYTQTSIKNLFLKLSLNPLLFQEFFFPEVNFHGQGVPHSVTSLQYILRSNNKTQLELYTDR